MLKLSKYIVFDARRALQNLKIVIFQNFRRPLGPTKRANGVFSKFSMPAVPYKNCKQLFSKICSSPRALHKLQTVFFQNIVILTRGPDLFYCFLALAEIYL